MIAYEAQDLMKDKSFLWILTYNIQVMSSLTVPRNSKQYILLVIKVDLMINGISILLYDPKKAEVTYVYYLKFKAVLLALF